MKNVVYVSLAGEDKISRFSMDCATGELSGRKDFAVDGGPTPLCTDSGKRFLYSGNRGASEIATFRVDPGTGGLAPIGALEVEANPCYLTTDKTNRFLLSAYYGAGVVAVHPIGEDGVAHGPPVEWRSTAPKAHCVETDASNRFAFVPHVGESNAIFQFRFDQSTGSLTPNAIPKVGGGDGQGPRHFVFHPHKDVVFADNEQESSVTAYHFDSTAGTLVPFQTRSTLPESFTGKNSNAQIRMHPTGRFLYASNRGHDSIACFGVDANTGGITSLGQQQTEGKPRAFNLDPDGRFLFVAGLATGRLASYRINDQGTLEPLAVYEVGEDPMWVLPVTLP